MVQTAAVESILRQVRESAHREVVGRVLATEEELDADWAPILARLRRDLAGATPAQVQAVVDQATRSMISAAVRRLANSVTAGAIIGANAAAREHERLTGPHGPMQPHGGVDAGPATIGTQRARQIAAERISGAAARDHVPLSARLYRSVDQVGRDAGRVIRSSIQAREGIFQTAENFIASNRDAMRVPVPRYTQDLIAAARESLDSGDRSVLEDAIRQHIGQMERLGIGPGQRDGLTSLRSTVRQFVRDLEQATPQSLERVVARHLEDRAQFQARRIARHETMEAHRSAYLASVREKPYAVGVRWKLSGLGHLPDVCDCFANQNLYGLGAGGYPKDRVPETPHPQCIPPGHTIETSTGSIPIELVVPGMMVRTHSGAWREVLRLSASEWRGQLVVATVGDRRLVATPEHPVLTVGGWKSADLLQPGDAVFLRRNADSSPSERSEVPVLDRVGSPLASREMPVAWVYFYSDEQARKCDVDVELSDGELRYRAEPSLDKRIEHAAFMLGELSDRLDLHRSRHESVESAALASRGSLRSGGDLLASLGGSPGVRDSVLLGRGSLRDSGSAKSDIDSGPSNSDASSDLEDAELLADVETNNLIDADVPALQRATASPADAERGLGASHPLLWSGPRCGDLGLLGPGSLDDSHIAEPHSNGALARHELPGDRVDAQQFAHVQARDLVRIDIHAWSREASACFRSGHFYLAFVDSVAREPYAGTVHNFAVDGDESYCVNGIVTHNCRCTTSAIVDEHFFTRRLAQRNAQPEPPRPWETDTRQTAAEWLAEQPESFRRRLLGPTRAQLFDEGRDGRAAVLDELGRPVPVAQLLPGRGAPPATPMTVSVADSAATARQLLESAGASTAGHPVPGNGIWAAIENGWPSARHQDYEDALAYLRANPDGPQWASRGADAEPPWRMTRSGTAGTYRNESATTWPHELDTDALLVAEGNDVYRPDAPPSHPDADLRISGFTVETKAILSDSAKIETALRAIRRARNQSGNIIYDWRASHMTAQDAEDVARSLEGDVRAPRFLRIIGRGFDLTWQLRLAST